MISNHESMLLLIKPTTKKNKRNVGMMVRPTKEATSFVLSFEPIREDEELKKSFTAFLKTRKIKRRSRIILTLIRPRTRIFVATGHIPADKRYMGLDIGSGERRQG